LAKACKLQAKVRGEKAGVCVATVAALEAAGPDFHLFLEVKSHALLTPHASARAFPPKYFSSRQRALDMKCPTELYLASTRRYDGLPELTYPLHDRDVLITACGRLCLHRKRINISTVLAGQRLGIKEVDEGIWLASFMHYDLGYFDLEQKTLQPLDNPFGTRLSPMS
jgi:hypothetical protein